MNAFKFIYNAVILVFDFAARIVGALTIGKYIAEVLKLHGIY